MDAANGYWAVRVWPAYLYKLAFSSSEGQMCYLRIGQGYIGGPAIYLRLKDIVTSIIPRLDSEPALSDVMPKKVCFNYYVDDDVSKADIFDNFLQFLYLYYFPRLT